MTQNEFRKPALGLPGAVEAAHMNHPDFRVAGKIFAALGYPDENWGMVRLTPEQQQTFMKKDAGAFQPCSGVWGMRGATNVHLSSVKKGILKTALESAVSNTFSQAKNKRA
jgi:hypothetical protein